MKKIILGTLLASCMLFASDGATEFESKLFDVSKMENGKTKDYLLDLEKLSPDIAKTLKDYFEAKTCKQDFYNTVTIDEVANFIIKTPTFAFLHSLNTLHLHYDKDTYLQIISNYRFLNCGEGKFQRYSQIQMPENLNELSISEFRDLLSSTKDETVWNPTDENVKNLKMLQDFMNQKAESFSSQMKKNSMEK